MKTSGKTCWVVNGGSIPYGSASELQRHLVQSRKVGAIPDVLFFCEHPHTITLGRNGRRENLLASEELLAQRNVEFHRTDRGGDITYHGPGQIVGYPILDLAEDRRDVRWYVEQLEEVMIRASADFGVTGKRVEEQHGVWIDTIAGEEKLAALGVHLSRWVTSHGFAYNVSTDLSYFDLVVPCGIAGKRPTSLERVLAHSVSLEEVRGSLASHFVAVFKRDLTNVSMSELADIIAIQPQNADHFAAATL